MVVFRHVPKPYGKGIFYGLIARLMIKINRKTKKQIKKKVDLFVINFFSGAIRPFSRFFRRVFEFAKIRQLFGVLVVSSVLSMAILPSSLSFVQTKVDTNFSEIQTVDPEIVKTEQSIRLPVDSFIVSQGYNFFHPGIDLAAVKGSPVYPIMEGTVISVDHGRFGYGNYVTIDHGSGFKSLYAHFAKIEAKVGEDVNQNSILGLVGSTGWSTGPHLHLQIWDQDKWTNPRAFFESYFGKKLASSK